MPLPESTMEWMPSEIMAWEPVMKAAMNLTMPTRTLPQIAAMTAMVELPFCEAAAASCSADALERLSAWDKSLLRTISTPSSRERPRFKKRFLDVVLLLGGWSEPFIGAFLS